MSSTKKTHPRKPKTFEKSFASYTGKTKAGKLKVDCWHPIKNNGIIPRNVFKSCNSKFWFTCDQCPHDFESSLGHVSSKKNRWCPYCTGQKMCSDSNCSFCHSRSFASCTGTTSSGKLKVEYWNSAKNNGLKPRNVSKGTQSKFWFTCDQCPHDFHSILSDVSGKNNTWCPYCAGRKLCSESNCSFCHNRSFASYSGTTSTGKLKVDCWNSKKNNGLTPRNVFKSCGSKFWFTCDQCPHDFDTVLSNVSGTRNGWCSYCAGQKMCSDSNCEFCLDHSFASYTGKTSSGKLKVDCWHPTKNNGLTSRNVSKSCNSKFWFTCDQCPHDFCSSLDSVSGKNNTWCPYCAGQKLCSESNCEFCHNRSFASYTGTTSSKKLKVDCWHPTKNKGVMPRNVSKGNDSKFWFTCDQCTTDFDTRLYNVTGKNQWCPHCKNKTELKLAKWLDKQDIVKTVQKEYSPNWCSTKYVYINTKSVLKSGKYLYRYDFLVTFHTGKQLIIELDGRQHFEQVMNWKGPFEQQLRDKYKEFVAKYPHLRNSKRGKKMPSILLVRCIQEDVYGDVNHWDTKLLRQLRKYS